MRALISCVEGLEAVTIEEIKRLLKTTARRVLPGVLGCDVQSREQIAFFAMHTRSALGVSLLLTEFTFESFNDLVEKVAQINLSQEIDGSFVVRCDRNGTHSFNSNDVERACGEQILGKTGVSVDVKSPKYTIKILIKEQQCFVGIDFVGFKLSKRDYRIKVVSSSLDPCIAFCMLMLGQWDVKEVLFDPFCKTGEVPIEAALYALGIPPFSHAREKFLCARFLDVKSKVEKDEKKVEILAYDALHINVRNAEVNAKLALVRKYITFSRTELEWVDTKFEKESVDKVVTALPLPSRFNQYTDFEKECKEFFHQMEYILRKKGTIVVTCAKPETVEKQAVLHHFKKEQQYLVRKGMTEEYILVLKRLER